jgi:putative membrane protein
MLERFGISPLDFFPAFNAGLNAASAVCLIAAWIAIKNRRIVLHRNLILTAFGIVIVFLTSYVYYHFVVRDPELSKYRGVGWSRGVYFAVLISHTILAMVVAVLAPITLYLGFGAPGNRHLWLARKVMPIWLYVSITGVIVYWMLYQM